MFLKFGTAGVRGIYPDELNEKVTFEIVKRFAEGKVFIGRDKRKSSPPLYYSAISAALSTGSEVFSLDMVPTPTTALMSYLEKTKAIHITASHNPEEFNGIKLIENGDIVRKEKANMIFNKEEKKGIGEIIEYKEIAERTHVERIIELFGEIKTKEKILLYCNGATENVFPLLMKKAKLEYTTLNCKNAHPPYEPSPMIPSMIKNFKGLAFWPDGDGDRVGVIINGSFLNFDTLAAFIAVKECERHKINKVVVNPATGLKTIEFLRSHGIEIYFSKTGTTYVWEKMVEKNAAVGTEPNGHIIIKDLMPLSDGIATAYLFIKYYEEDKTIINDIEKINTYRVDGKIKATEDQKEKLRKNIEELLNIEGKSTTIDGLRIDGEEFWILVRPSGTEPVIRYTVEAKSKELMETLKRKVEKSIKEVV